MKKINTTFLILIIANIFLTPIGLSGTAFVMKSFGISTLSSEIFLILGWTLSWSALFMWAAAPRD